MIDNSTVQERFLASGIDKQLRIIFDEGDILTNKEIFYESQQITESICSDIDLRIGACEASSYKVTIANDGKRYKGKSFSAYLVLDGDTANPFRLGKYRVESDVPTANRLQREITAYDLMYDIIHFSAVRLAGWYYDLFDSKETVTAKEFRDSFFTFIGLRQESTTLINDNAVIRKGIETEQLSGKDIIQAICELNGVFGHFDRDGVFRYITLDSDIKSGGSDATYPSAVLYPLGTVYPSSGSGNIATITKQRYSHCEYEDFVTNTISQLCIKTDEGSNGCTVGTGENVYSITGNFLTYGMTDEELQSVAENIYSKISNISYRPIKNLVTKGNPCLEVGDRIEIEVNGEMLNTYILERTLSGIQALSDTFIANGKEDYIEDGNNNSSKINQVLGKAQSALNTANEASEAVSGISSRVSIALQEVEEAKENIRNAQTMIDETKEEVQSALNQVADARDEVDSARDSITSAIQEVSEALADIQEVNNTIAGMEETINKNSQDVATAVSNVNEALEDVASLRQSISQNSQNIASAVEEINSAKQDVSGVSQALATARQEINEAIQAVSEAQASGQLVDGSVTEDKIARGAVTETKIGSGAVTSAKIYSGAVIADKIAANAVTSGKIATNAVTSEKIYAGSVLAEKIASNAVTADKILASAVTAEKIATGAVTSNKIYAEAVTSVKIASEAVTTEKLYASAVTAEKIATNAVTADKILANAVTSQKINANAVTTDKISANAVTAGKIASNAVTTAKLDASAVTAEKIASNAVTADKILAGSVTAGKIATNAVTSDKINAGAVTAQKIESGAITTEKLASNAVTADKINVNDLFAQNINATGIINGVTIKGANGEFTEGFKVSIHNENNKRLIIDAFSPLSEQSAELSITSEDVSNDTDWEQTWFHMAHDSMELNYQDNEKDYSIFVRNDGITLKGNVHADGYTVTAEEYRTMRGKVGERIKVVNKAISLPSSTSKAVASITLSAGLWMIVCSVRFPANSNGDRRISLVQTNGATDAHNIVRAVGSGLPTQVCVPKILEFSSERTYYLNATQNSGSTLSLEADNNTYIEAVRIA